MVHPHPLDIRAERDVRGPGCDERCTVERVLRAGVFGRSELLLHAASAHEEYGRRIGRLDQLVDGGVVRTGPLGIDIGRWTVTLDDESLHLTPTELRLLMALARCPGLLVPYTEVAAAVWGPSFLLVGPAWWRHGIRVNVGRLRHKLGRAGGLVVSVVAEGLKLRVVARDAQLTAPGQARWARAWDACRDCGGTDRQHKAKGYCTRCRERIRN